MDPNVLSVTVRNRAGVVYEGDCLSVTSYNKVGKFDILGKHANFITLVEKELILRPKLGAARTIPIENGVCKVRENQVSIFLGVRK